MTGESTCSAREDAKITSIRPLPSDPEVRSVRVGTRVVGRLPAAEIESLGLTEGQSWTDELASAVSDAIAARRGRRMAMRLLGQRGYSVAELVERLEGRGLAPSIACRVVERLVEDGWLDEAAFATSLAQSILRRAPCTERLLLTKLHQRMVDPAVAEHVAREVLRQAHPEADALALARRHLERSADLPPATAARRIAGVLARRGFEDQTIASALDQLGLLHDDTSA